MYSTRLKQAYEFEHRNQGGSAQTKGRSAPLMQKLKQTSRARLSGTKPSHLPQTRHRTITRWTSAVAPIISCALNKTGAIANEIAVSLPAPLFNPYLAACAVNPLFCETCPTLSRRPPGYLLWYFKETCIYHEKNAYQCHARRRIACCPC